MSSPVYHHQAHRASWHSATRQHKCPAEYYGEPPRLRQPSSKGMLRAIRRSLCRMFGSRQAKRHTNDSVDSFAYAQSDDSFVAESLDEDNLAWGSPPKSSRNNRSSREKSGGRGDMNKEESSSDPSSPDSAQASCRLW